jgi:integrase/recombinase XerD
VSAEITLAGAITGLVTEKRALGYKYVCEERTLARFRAFCASAFPGLDKVTRASVEAWIACARRRAVKPATVNSLIAPVRELARWLHRRGVDAYVLPAGVLEKPARYIPHVYSDQELAALFAQTDRCRYCSGGAVPASGDARPVPHDLRVRAAVLGSSAAAREGRRHRHGRAADP